jgi:hypothetical protein
MECTNLKPETTAVAQVEFKTLLELDEVQLTLVGGGIGDPIAY